MVSPTSAAVAMPFQCDLLMRAQYHRLTRPACHYRTSAWTLSRQWPAGLSYSGHRSGNCDECSATDRQAGSFVRFAIDRYGIERMLEFFRISSRNDSIAVIKERFLTAFGVSFDTAESDWLTMLR